MTRKDIIIIAVLANMGVLAILFMLAFRNDDDKTPEQPEISYTIVEASSEQPDESENAVAKTEPADEVDAVLEDLRHNSTTDPFSADEDDAVQLKEVSNEQSQDDRFVEITIKRGDALEKIARANGTTVEAIKQANHLKTDRLKIGQVLQIPVGTSVKPAEPARVIASNTNSSEIQYYTIKSGDNPWKIAKQFQIRVDQLLKLNDLNEDTARNLKIGDQIRVK